MTEIISILFMVSILFFMTSTMLWIKRINNRINDLEREIDMRLNRIY